MRVLGLRLSNFKCYASVDASLSEGVTVIHGPNGAGKSSLLEAVSFALYGAGALDATLEDVVTRGADDAEVELRFEHAGTTYRIERRIRATGERAQTASCVLETPAGTVEGARDVEARVASLLRMDAEAFVNCAYVRQGEVNKLINATPEQRQRMLDDLLQLGRLEEYRERAAEARLGVEDVRNDARGSLGEIESQLAAKEERNLHDQLNELESARAEVTAELERFEENRDRATEQLEAAREVLASHAERREELEELEESISTLSERVAETEREREELAERIADRRERGEALADDRDELTADTDLEEPTPAAVEAALAEQRATLEALAERREELAVERTECRGTRETALERAEELEGEAEAAREAAAELEAEAQEAEADLEERRTQLTTLQADVEDATASFEGAPVEPGEAEAHRESLVSELDELRERRGELQADLETARHRVEHAEGLLEEGRCPECGQPVDGSPHVDALEDRREDVAELEADMETLEAAIERTSAAVDRADELVEAERELERLRTERENLEQLLEEREAAVEAGYDRAEAQTARAEELADRAAEHRETAAEAAERLETLEARAEELTDERERVEAAIDRLEALAERLEQLEALETALDRLREKRELLGGQNEERRETLRERRQRRDELEAAVEEERVERAREEQARAEAYLERVEDKLAELSERRDELQSQIGAVENELETLEELRDRRATLADRVERLESLHDEASDLQALYADLRAELRRQNIASLDRLLNETFTLVYQNDAYARLELDEEYELTVFQKDGERLDPEQLSGGERALFNLSLRTAIYRLLAEGVEGAAPMPPLILDEPTVFLDAGHVSRLVELIEAMRDLGVEQIIVVSHDEELVGAADELLTVRKDPTTNRSTVEQGVQPELVAD